MTAMKSAFSPSPEKHSGKILFCQKAMMRQCSSLATPVSVLNLVYSVRLPSRKAAS